ncbi:hypothetical protein EHF33_14120 [Deinococcus psychrotolerans]|uniref:ASCH domain-containing protein n=1 Tax=Deinococcus psychrotolerans TaxID=2489213 RepID=A0A3G8YQS7_9DEIO|nr:hypothetical protein [Deinococcus psychrotolerans]AZI44051.1 hypothetical protein EHF33_14120 [Deinococcus psychrotolerans]
MTARPLKLKGLEDETRQHVLPPERPERTMDCLTPPLFGLTLNQPWPLCIQQLGKDVENRTWHPQEWGGEVGMLLAIHGGQPPRKLDGNAVQAHDFRQHLDWIAHHIVNPSPWAAPGQYHWVLSAVTPVEPIASVGTRGLWPIEDAIGLRLRAALSQNAGTRSAS